MSRTQKPQTATEYRAELARMESFWQERGWIESAARRYQRLQRELAALETKAAVRTYQSDALGAVTIPEDDS